MKKFKEKGFTLIELIAVLVIMAIIALIVTPLVMNIIRKARISADKRSIDAYGRSIELAIAGYLLDNGKFPTSVEQLTIEYSGNEVVCSTTQLNSDSSVYLAGCTVAGRTVDYTYGEDKEPKPATYDLLSKANPVSVTSYTDGDTKEMYTFEHPATEQTGALTDYRYIGASPNNYVTFNNELWRIIGVFTVEDGNGNTEQRIKIVRNTKLDDKMNWDSNNVNEWSTASLNTYLNGDYYNGLDATSKSMFSNTKYYLGGLGSNNADSYSAETYYTWERGTTVYSGRSTFWNGKIALMYPSDYIYTYALGVDNTCYIDAVNCSPYGGNDGVPTNGWLYNNYYQYLLSNSSHTNYDVSYINGNGPVSWQALSSYGMSPNNITPTLYLSSQVKIASGDGSEQSPYQLSM